MAKILLEIIIDVSDLRSIHLQPDYSIDNLDSRNRHYYRLQARRIWHALQYKHLYDWRIDCSSCKLETFCYTKQFKHALDSLDKKRKTWLLVFSERLHGNRRNNPIQQQLQSL